LDGDLRAVPKGMQGGVRGDRLEKVGEIVTIATLALPGILVVEVEQVGKRGVRIVGSKSWQPLIGFMGTEGPLEFLKTLKLAW